jgi:hypothetical protein
MLLFESNTLYINEISKDLDVTDPLLYGDTLTSYERPNWKLLYA